VPADGFYEWTGSVGAKRPHLIRPRQRCQMAMAAIYENWLGADGSEIETMAILTTAANATMSVLHDRMPVLIAAEHFDLWLDCRSGTTTEIAPLLAPAPDDLLDIVEVSRKLNNSRNEGPEVQEPVVAARTLL
jgi:putative SOS response-associated peptidase YedK